MYEILIVDDTPSHISFQVSLLKPKGYKIHAVTSGKLALEFLKKSIPDLILLDIQMPNMDGYEVCKKIKSIELLRDIPIIFSTASDDEESIRKSFECGGQDYVVKPFKTEEYIARINTHIMLSKKSVALKEAYDELDKFCYSVSHDLKSPLNVINQLVSMLNDNLIEHNQINKETSEIMECIKEKSSNSVKMVERLLEFSRMCEQDINPISIDIRKVYNEIYTDLKSLSEYNNRTVNMEIKGDTTHLLGDEISIRCLVQNILSNAFKFTSHKDVATIIVNIFQNVNSVTISTIDNGAGFDMKYSNKLFNVFSRLHDVSEFQGTGIGLAICKRIVERHHGSISITSKLDIGTTITFTI